MPDEGDDLGQRVGERQEHEADLVGLEHRPTASMFWTTFVRRLPCVSAQPFGRPVVPDVYTIVASRSVVIPAMRCVEDVVVDAVAAERQLVETAARRSRTTRDRPAVVCEAVYIVVHRRRLEDQLDRAAVARGSIAVARPTTSRKRERSRRRRRGWRSRRGATRVGCATSARRDRPPRRRCR